MNETTSMKIHKGTLEKLVKLIKMRENGESRGSCVGNLVDAEIKRINDGK